MEEAIAMAEKIAANSAFSLGVIKKGLNMASEVSLEALMDYEIEGCLATVSAPERVDKLEEFADRKK
jgi:enoyl-CoA hydratase